MREQKATRIAEENELKRPKNFGLQMVQELTADDLKKAKEVKLI